MKQYIREYLSEGTTAKTASKMNKLENHMDVKSKKQNATEKRQQRRRQEMLKKLQQALGEYATVIGEQVCLIYANSVNNRFWSYGTHPLTDVMNRSKGALLKQLGNVGKQSSSDGYLQELPLLELRGKRVGIGETTQSMMRSLLPRLIKLSMGCDRAGWGNPKRQPVWWPIQVLPWWNIRVDRRNAKQKSQMTWTEALRIAVTNCYAYYNRLDILYPEKENLQHINEGDPLIGGKSTSSDGSQYDLSFTENTQSTLKSDAKGVQDEEDTTATKANAEHEILLNGTNFALNQVFGDSLVHE